MKTLWMLLLLSLALPGAAQIKFRPTHLTVYKIDGFDFHGKLNLLQLSRTRINLTITLGNGRVRMSDGREYSILEDLNDEENTEQDDGIFFVLNYTVYRLTTGKELLMRLIVDKEDGEKASLLLYDKEAERAYKYSNF